MQRLDNGSMTAVSTRPSQQVQWHHYRAHGYKIQCLSPFKRFRGVEIPWENPMNLGQVTEFVAKSSRSRKVVKLAAGQFGTPVELYVKRYNFKTWYAPYLRVLRSSRAREEFELGWALMDAGIRTPRPVWLAEADNTVSRYSMIATEAIPGAENGVERWIHAQNEDERRELLVAFGSYFHTLHERGFYHDDCKAAHVLVLPHARNEPEKFFMIDLAGCKLLGRLTAYRRAKNLYQVLHSLMPRKGNGFGFTKEHANIFLSAYAGSPMEARPWVKWVDRIGRLKGRRL